MVSFGATGSCSLLQLRSEGTDFFFREKSGALSAEEVRTRVAPTFLPQTNWNDDGAAVKDFTLTEADARRVFGKGAYAYFPASRSEMPQWLNRDSLPSDAMALTARASNTLGRPIYVERGIEKLKQWLLTLLVDVRIDAPHERWYDGTYVVRPNVQWTSAVTHEKVLNAFNSVLRRVLNDSKSRLAWSGRQNQPSLGINFDSPIKFLPFEALSTVQATLLNIFGTLLRYGDEVMNPVVPDQLEGICLIDEIDAHMHIDLQYRALPALIQMFPKVQFIVTSHAPIFVLGMDQACTESGVCVVELPSGTPLQAESFAEFGRALEVFEQTSAFNHAVLVAAGKVGKMLVLLEGETDPLYLVAAIRALGRDALLEDVEIVWVGAHDKKGQAFHTGQDAMKSTETVLRANPELTRRHVLLLYDNDVRWAEEDIGKLHIRCLPAETVNEHVEAGIESLLPNSVFTADMFQETTDKKKGGKIVRITDIRKMELCRSVCGTNPQADSFVAFGPVLDVIDAVVNLMRAEQAV